MVAVAVAAAAAAAAAADQQVVANNRNRNSSCARIEAPKVVHEKEQPLRLCVKLVPKFSRKMAQRCNEEHEGACGRMREHLGGREREREESAFVKTKRAAKAAAKSNQNVTLQSNPLSSYRAKTRAKRWAKVELIKRWKKRKVCHFLL